MLSCEGYYINLNYYEVLNDDIYEFIFYVIYYYIILYCIICRLFKSNGKYF